MKKTRWPLLSFLLLSLFLEINGQGNPFFRNPRFFNRINPNFLTNTNLVRRGNGGSTPTTNFQRTATFPGTQTTGQQTNQATRTQPTRRVATVTVPVIELAGSQQQQPQQPGTQQTTAVRQATGGQGTNQQFPFGNFPSPQAFPSPFGPSFGGPPATGFAFGARPMGGGFGPTLLGMQPNINGFGLGPGITPQINFPQSLPPQAVMEMQAAAGGGLGPQFGAFHPLFDIMEVLQTQPVGGNPAQRGPPAQQVSGNFPTGPALGQGPVSGFPPTGFNGFPRFNMGQQQPGVTTQQQNTPQGVPQGVPQMPQFPQNQQTSQFPQNQQTPQFPQNQQTSQFPQNQQTPQPQQIPQNPQIPQNAQMPQNPQMPQIQGQQPQPQQNPQFQINNFPGAGFRPQFPRLGRPSPFSGQNIGFSRPNMRRIPPFRGMNMVMPGMQSIPQNRIPQIQPNSQQGNGAQPGVTQQQQPQGAQNQNNQITPQVRPGQNPFAPPSQRGPFPGFPGPLPGMMPPGAGPFPGMPPFGASPPNFPGQGMPPAAPQSVGSTNTGFTRTIRQPMSQQQISSVASLNQQALPSTRSISQSLQQQPFSPRSLNLQRQPIPHVLPRLPNQQPTPRPSFSRLNVPSFSQRHTRLPAQQTANLQPAATRPLSRRNFLDSFRTPLTRQSGGNPVSQENFLDPLSEQLPRSSPRGQLAQSSGFQPVSRLASPQSVSRPLARQSFLGPLTQPAQSFSGGSRMQPVLRQASAQSSLLPLPLRSFQSQTSPSSGQRNQPMTLTAGLNSRQSFDRPSVPHRRARFGEEVTSEASQTTSTNAITEVQPPSIPLPPQGFPSGDAQQPPAVAPPGFQSNPIVPPGVFGGPVPAFPVPAEAPGNEGAPSDASNSVASVPGFFRELGRPSNPFSGFGTGSAADSTPVEVPTLSNSNTAPASPDASAIVPGQSPPGFPQMTFTGDFGTAPLDIPPESNEPNTPPVSPADGPSPSGNNAPQELGASPPGFGSSPPGMSSSFPFGVDTIPSPAPPPPPVVPFGEVPTSVQLGIDQPLLRPNPGSTGVFSDTGSIGVIPGFPNIPTSDISPGLVAPVQAETRDNFPTVVSVAELSESTSTVAKHTAESNKVQTENPSTINTESTIPTETESAFQTENLNMVKNENSRAAAQSGSQNVLLSGSKDTTISAGAGIPDGFPPIPDKAITETKAVDILPFLRQ